MDRAVGFAWTSTVSLGVGAAALATAAVLFFSERSGRPSTARAPGALFAW
jgi:hypothetical protein